ncbi:MAG: ribose-phosphate diphosphokinase [Acidimicrobiales bacterium]|jgi:ribose-phosphate pyrophosphokinase|nr:ribose-phosphate diphosphokinase [Acidimicrobiales bacterium]
MEQITQKKLYLVSGRVSEPLAREVAGLMDEELGEPNLAEFSNGEIHCKFSESIRGSDVFILQTHCHTAENSINDALMEQLIMVDAAKRASAKRITVVCPHYGYARQDRKSSGREPITAKLVANLFKVAGASRLIGVDLHSGQIQGFFDGPVDHLTAMPVLVERLKDLTGEMAIVSPDAGRVKVAERYAMQLGADLAIVHKRRSHTAFNTVEAKEVVGDVDGKNCVIVDDMIDTAGTICAAAEQLKEKGAEKVWAATTHGVFSGPAMERLNDSAIEKVLVTNTLPMPEGYNTDLIEVLSIAPLLARTLQAVFQDTSVSEIFGGDHLS